MKFHLPALAALALPAAGLQSAELIHFTTDGQAGSPALLPAFVDDSCWSGICASRAGNVYIAISNHEQPGGNAAVYKYDPVGGSMTALGDLKSVSSAVNNWMAEESQYKVHSFLTENEDGRIYFASDDHFPTPFLRGAHIYTIDTATDVLSDFSKTQPVLMTSDLAVIPNTMQPQEQSGVFIETYGIKGLSLNRREADVMYAMTYPAGHLIRYGLLDGSMEKVGESSNVSYVYYADNHGNVYYARPSTTGTGLELVKYHRVGGATTVIEASFPGVELGAIAPTASGEVVYVLEADTKRVYRLDCVQDTFDYVATCCGTNWWRLYNLSLSPNEEALYYVSNNNAASSIRRIDLETTNCTQVLDVNSLLGSRDLCFGGVNVWDGLGNLYAPVWSWSGHGLPRDVALLKVQVGERPLEGAPAQIALSQGGSQTLSLRAGPGNADHLYLVLGSLHGTTPGFSSIGFHVPLAPDAYLLKLLVSPNTAPMAQSLGFLDGSGRGTATFKLPAGFEPSLAWSEVHHAFVALDPVTFEPQLVSNPISLQLLP